MAKIHKKADIIGVLSDLGAEKSGFDLAPPAIRNAGLCDKLSSLGITVRDRGDIIPVPGREKALKMEDFTQVADVNDKLYAMVKDSLQSGAFPIILGGDHSVSAGSIPAVSECFGDVGIIWFDAHGDFNDRQSSFSGSINGMPFSAVCGLGPGEMLPVTGYYVNPRRAVLIGARDLDALERPRLKDAGVTVFSIREIDRLGIQEVIRQAIEIAGRDTKGIYVSFDIDSIDPESAPGVGFPVHHGLTVREALFMAEILHQSGKVLALDMVEVNPVFDEKNRTSVLACELILSLMGKALY